MCWPRWWQHGWPGRRRRRFAALSRASRRSRSERVRPLSGIPLKGAHNVENVLAAVVAARLAGAPAEAIRRAVESFQAVEIGKGEASERYPAQGSAQR